nr:hypothetical protein [Actinocrispum wychmicini]
MNEEYRFKEAQVVLRTALLHPDGLSSRGDGQHLSRPGGQLVEELGQHLALPDSAQLDHIALDNEIEIVAEPART